MVGYAGHVYGCRPSEMLGMQNTSKGLWLDVMMAPKTLRLVQEGSTIIDELIGDEPARAGMVAKEVKKNTAWMKDPDIQERMKGRY